jgi:hypothetical protein
MATVKRKSTFGSSYIDHFSPALPTGTPKAINVTLSFEEALKLHLKPGAVAWAPERVQPLDGGRKAHGREPLRLHSATAGSRG